MYSSLRPIYFHYVNEVKPQNYGALRCLFFIEEPKVFLLSNTNDHLDTYFFLSNSTCTKMKWLQTKPQNIIFTAMK